MTTDTQSPVDTDELGEVVAAIYDLGGDDHAQLVERAADELESLRAKVAEHENAHEAAAEVVAHFQERVAALSLQNDQLRKALEGLFDIEWTKRQIHKFSLRREAARLALRALPPDAGAIGEVVKAAREVIWGDDDSTFQQKIERLTDKLAALDNPQQEKDDG